MKTIEKQYLKPISVREALTYAELHQPRFRFIAGGTDLLVNKFQGNEDSLCLIDLNGVDELKSFTINHDYLHIGALVKLDDLRKNQLIQNQFPALIESAHAAASPMIRKTATLGGNILCENRCTFYNQSEWWRDSVGYCLKCDGDVCIATGGTKACFSNFVSDTAPVLISLDALIEVIDSKGVKTIPLESIFTGDGIHPRNLAPDAIISFILLPIKDKSKTIFKKLRPREAVDFTSLTTSVTLFESNRLKLVIGGVDPRPIIVEGTVTDDPAELIKQAVKKCRIVENAYYSRSYRKEMIRVFLENSLKEIQHQ
jgi:4-hydroxybenzoyl-CoA reductase subunit beta